MANVSPVVLMSAMAADVKITVPAPVTVIGALMGNGPVDNSDSVLEPLSVIGALTVIGTPETIRLPEAIAAVLKVKLAPLVINASPVTPLTKLVTPVLLPSASASSDALAARASAADCGPAENSVAFVPIVKAPFQMSRPVTVLIVPIAGAAVTRSPSLVPTVALVCR